MENCKTKIAEEVSGSRDYLYRRSDGCV